MIIETILTAIWLFFPAGVANMMATTSRLFPKTEWMAKPVDMGIMFRGKRLLGKNKTARGFFFALLFAVLIGLLQKYLYDNVEFISETLIIDDVIEGGYSAINVALFSFLAGLGAMIGDMVESFIKRQIDIAPGKPFFPFDQTDFIIGAILITIIHAVFTVDLYIALLGSFFFLHLTLKYVGYLIGIDKTGF